MKFIKIFIIILFKKKPTLADIYKHWISVRSAFTFFPTSIGGKSTKGTSLVVISHKTMAKLHMSAERWSTSSGFLFKTERKKIYRQN